MPNCCGQDCLSIQNSKYYLVILLSHKEYSLKNI